MNAPKFQSLLYQSFRHNFGFMGWNGCFKGKHFSLGFAPFGASPQLADAL
jgi:hypothetical protein